MQPPGNIALPKREYVIDRSNVSRPSQKTQVVSTYMRFESGASLASFLTYYKVNIGQGKNS